MIYNNGCMAHHFLLFYKLAFTNFTSYVPKYLDPFCFFTHLDQELSFHLLLEKMSLINAKHFTLLIFLCFLVIQESHGCTTSSLKCISLKEVAPVRLLNRKVLESQWVAFGKGYYKYNHAEKINEKLADWELRGVPAGPDPLHHHGASPKKPRTP